MTDTPRELADQAAEAIRTMNHLTRDGEWLEFPSDVYDVVASIKVMSERLPQLFGQLTKWLWAEQEAGRVRHDAAESSNLAVLDVDSFLVSAQEAARALYDALNGAHSALGHLKGAG